MRVVCSGCGADMGEKDGQDGISHSLCHACLRNLYPEEAEAIIQKHGGDNESFSDCHFDHSDLVCRGAGVVGWD